MIKSQVNCVRIDFKNYLVRREFIFMKFKTVFFEICTIIFASMVISIGLNVFLADAKLLSGGLTGISFLIEYTTGLNAGLLYLALNIPLFILSYFKLSLKFTIYSIIGTVCLSSFLFLTSGFKGVLNVNDPLLRCIFGGVLAAIGYALMFRVRASTGGIDILAFIIRKKNPAFNLGDVSFLVNLCIVALSIVLLKDVSKAMYSLISMFLTSSVVNKLVFGFNKKFLVLIITKSPDSISNYILNVIKRGVTSLESEGCYTGEKQNILYTVLDMNQYVSLRNKINDLDEHAFLSVMETKSVYGNGFSEV